MSNNIEYRSKTINIDYCLNILKPLNEVELTLFDNKKNFDIGSTKFTFINKGGHGYIYKMESTDCKDIILKITKNVPESEHEIIILSRLKDLIDNNICPNFLYYYNNLFLFGKYYILVEIANGTAEDWMMSKHSVEEWKSFLFQFLISVYIFQIYIKGYHTDLHFRNIFYKKIKTDTYFEYNVDGNKYYIPTYGKLFMMADFDKVQSLLFNDNKIDDVSIKLFIQNNTDLEHIITLHKRILVSYIEKQYTLHDLINIIRQKNDQDFDAYLAIEKRKISEKFKNHKYKIDQKIFRNVAYYIIEKNYITLKDISDEKQKLKLPPLDIIDFIDRYLNIKSSIPTILTHFDEFKILPIGADIIHKFTVKS